ncbi:MAG: hypothetical protein LUE27_01360 [Clostridia bacterium]|nr:hypothetical protein [Clostridia bacterium]
MKLIRKLFTKITRPSLYATCMIVLIFVALGLFTIFAFLSGAPVSGLILLFLAAIFLGYGAYAIIVLILKNWPRLEKWSEGRRFFNRFVMSYDFRTICTTILTMTVNIGFAVFNAVYGFMYMEWWCVSLFVYYLMLIVMRSSISARALRVSRRFDDTDREDAQLRVYQMAAIMLLVFTLALNFLLWELLSQEDFGFRNHVLISIVTGIYVVIKVILAVSNLIYTRGRHDKVTHAVRNINMADALVSVMTLLMTFLTRFSDSHTAVVTVRVLGTIICLYVAAMAIFMLVNSVVKIKRNRRTLYEMLMDSLNEDFENSLEEPAWEAVYAAACIGSVEYTIGPVLAEEEKDASISDGVLDQTEATAGAHDPVLIPAEEHDPGFYKKMYAIAGMDPGDIPAMTEVPDAGPVSGADEDEEEEPTPLPASWTYHSQDDEDGLDDDAAEDLAGNCGLDEDYVPGGPAEPANSLDSAEAAALEIAGDEIREPADAEPAEAAGEPAEPEEKEEPAASDGPEENEEPGQAPAASDEPEPAEEAPEEDIPAEPAETSPDTESQEDLE